MATAGPRTGAPGIVDDGAPPVVAPPPGHPRFPLVDSLRALAALAVVLAHVTKINGTAPGPWGTVFYNLGQHTLAIFFILSGFLIYRPFVNAQMNGAPRPALPRFFWRRVLRIVPAYWVALTLLAIYPGLPGVFTDEWWRYYFLLSIYDQDTVAQGLLVSWTMCVEVTFYMLLPLHVALMAWLAQRISLLRRVKIELLLLVVLSLGSVAIREIDLVTSETAAVQNSLLSLYYWFAIGMGLAVVSSAVQGGELTRSVARIAAHPVRCWAVAGVVLLFLMAFMDTDGHYSNVQWVLGYYVLSGVVSLFIFMPAVFTGNGRGWPRRFMAHPLLAWLGLVAYGVYLWHVPLMSWLYTHGIESTPELMFAGVFASVTFGAASYYIVERPILRFKNFRFRRSPRGVAAKEPAAQTAAASRS
jgi:peptidoglycan/LPS O-acetylase OafA/YrhL